MSDSELNAAAHAFNAALKRMEAANKIMEPLDGKTILTDAEDAILQGQLAEWKRARRECDAALLRIRAWCDAVDAETGAREGIAGQGECS